LTGLIYRATIPGEFMRAAASGRLIRRPQLDRGTGQKGGLVTAESGLKWLLRFMCFTTLFAFFAAVMPQSWLVHWINKGAPGTPVGVLVTYLARMLMIMYAFVGLEFLIISMDIPRYLPLIWVLGVESLALALIGLTVLFTQVPPGERNAMFWIVFVDFAEGLAQGILLVVLLLCIRRHATPQPERG